MTTTIEQSPWLELFGTMEEQPQQPPPPPLAAQRPRLVIGIGTNDIMMGRGLGPRNHPGNERYTMTVDTHRARYEAATSRPEKTRIVDDIVQIIKQTGRFLKRVDNDADVWVEVDDTAARSKVGQVRW